MKKAIAGILIFLAGPITSSALPIGAEQVSDVFDGQYKTGAGDLLRTNSQKDELEISTDGGSSWQTIFAHSTIWKFSARASDKIWVGYRCGSEDACVSYSKDKGQSWVN
jgi:hypothetical protein